MLHSQRLHIVKTDAVTTMVAWKDEQKSER